MGFHDRWERKHIKDLTKVSAGATPKTSKNEYWGGNIRWMSSGELNLKHIYDVEGRITDLGYNSTSTKMLPKECVLIGLAGQGKTRGTCAINHIELCTNQSIGAIWPCKDFSSLFLYFYLDSRYKELRELSSGDGGRGGLNLPLIANLSIPVCSIKEQLKIAEFLFLLEQRIVAQNKIIEDLESLEKGIIHQSIWGREYGKTTLYELLSERTERTSKQDQFVILSSTVTGLLTQEEYFNHQVASANNVGYKVVRKGDVILSPQNLWLGNINYNDRFEYGMVSPSYKVFSIKNCYAPFLSLFLKTKRMKYLYGLCSEQGASVVRRNLNLEQFLQIIVPMPTIEVQKSITEKVLAVRRKISNEQKYRDLLLIQKKYLLENMFI